MGQMDCSLLYALVRTFRPRVAVETGANVGMASSFILEGMHDAGVTDGKFCGVEDDTTMQIGSMIPEELREQLGPGEIDFFLHDSMHRSKHQYWEFKHFWKRLRPGGLLVSHDVNMKASFVDFISRTYAYDWGGVSVEGKTQHTHWARWGNLGFMVKV